MGLLPFQRGPLSDHHALLLIMHNNNDNKPRPMLMESKLQVPLDSYLAQQPFCTLKDSQSLR